VTRYAKKYTFTLADAYTGIMYSVGATAAAIAILAF
jgi:hypothetical protein